MEYELHTAIWDDVESGAIWISPTPASTFTSRTIVHVRNEDNHRSIRCEAKMVDEYYLKRFTEQTGHTVDETAQHVFINAWYRKALGLTTRQGPIKLAIVADESLPGKLRACLQHPQVVVRIATVLGLWSVALGIISLALGILSLVR